jgi:hypothetical protein
MAPFRAKRWDIASFRAKQWDVQMIVTWCRVLDTHFDAKWRDIAFGACPDTHQATARPARHHVGACPDVAPLRVTVCIEDATSSDRVQESGHAPGHAPIHTTPLHGRKTMRYSSSASV